MAFDFDECIEVLRNSLTGALAAHGEAIRALNQVEPLWAISFDILPWDPNVGIAFRLESESGTNASSNSADWKHAQLIGDWNAKELVAAKEYTHQAYQARGSDGKRCQEAAHLIFLAAAHALLDERVAFQLQSFGVDAPVVGEKLPWNYFKYMVADDDGVIKANYCDIVCANRVTRRVLGRII
jgi:hypothetical protein